MSYLLTVLALLIKAETSRVDFCSRTGMSAVNHPVLKETAGNLKELFVRVTDSGWLPWTSKEFKEDIHKIKHYKHHILQDDQEYKRTA